VGTTPERSRVYHSPFFNSPIFSVNYAINEEANSNFTDGTEVEIFVNPQGKVWGDSISLRRISPKEAQKIGIPEEIHPSSGRQRIVSWNAFDISSQFLHTLCRWNLHNNKESGSSGFGGWKPCMPALSITDGINLHGGPIGCGRPIYSGNLRTDVRGRSASRSTMGGTIRSVLSEPV
jgi:hypothetical protein